MRLTFTIAFREFRAYRRTCFAHGLATAYLVLTGTLWVYALHTHEGGALSPVALWAQLHATLLPLFAIFATLRTFAAERSQGTLDGLLTTGAPLDEIIAGKYLAALVLTLGTLALSALGPFLILPNVVSGAGAEMSAPALLAGFSMLALQAVMWTSLGIFLSTLLRSQALVAAAALLLAGAVPYGLRFLNVAFLSPLVHPHHVAADATLGVFSLFPIVCYAALTPALLFMSARACDFYFYRTR